MKSVSNSGAEHLSQVLKPTNSNLGDLSSGMKLFPSSQRSFSTINVLLREWKLVESRQIPTPKSYQVGDSKPLYIPKKKIEFPDYPYGESPIYKQSNKGLYGASFIQFGNNIAESKTKTRRSWSPNVIRKGLWSEGLDKKISIKMTAKVLKTITKEGGIDKYLTKEKSARIKELGPAGWKLRYRLLKAQEHAANPVHQDAETVTDVNGSPVTVLYKVVVDGEPLRVIVGKRKLLHTLFPLEQMEQKADGLHLSFKKFLEVNATREVAEIVSRLKQLDFDLSTIIV
ncbi:unnamed protein product [Kluyveromyces dobzhanskii CBS 2104]|uniref:Large ribosomal subunit protein bL28m n=1 Tax=Kluyveromyces dobzhanskii CBS 2104 TaxID=1427455 RepID=A0A0A8L6G2_9SACH|nr:unnamed protein product [Kluyveromyces dobzhanskii CBS 2104]